MEASSVLRAGFSQAHRILEGVIGDCDDAALHRVEAGATVGSIAAVYLHTVCDEDMFVQGMLQGQPTVFQSGGFEGRVGLPFPNPRQSPEWASTVRLENLAAFREYAAAVYAATDAYLAGLSASDLDREVEFAGQKQPLGGLLAGLVLWHTVSHQGEISALKGAQGLKGLPF